MKLNKVAKITYLPELKICKNFREIQVQLQVTTCKYVNGFLNINHIQINFN